MFWFVSRISRSAVADGGYTALFDEVNDQWVIYHDGEIIDFKNEIRGMFVHEPSACKGQACSVHNPSRHSMVDFPRLWRADRGLMERTCPHGVGHPDPDNLAFIRRERGEDAAFLEGIHGCDGCCALVAEPADALRLERSGETRESSTLSERTQEK